MLAYMCVCVCASLSLPVCVCVEVFDFKITKCQQECLVKISLGPCFFINPLLVDNVSGI